MQQELQRQRRYKSQHITRPDHPPPSRERTKSVDYLRQKNLNGNTSSENRSLHSEISEEGSSQRSDGSPNLSGHSPRHSIGMLC